MKMNSISGVKYEVKDVAASVQFYESLGFRVGNQTAESATCYVNWFWVTFVASSNNNHKGIGQSLHIKVDDIEEFHKGVVGLGLKPDGKPQKQPSGNVEFALSDPDGYRLIFFFKK